MPGDLKAWGAMLRLHQLPAGLAPAAAGLAYAYWKTGQFSVWPAAAALFLVALTQMGGMFLNDFFDHESGVDWKTKNRTPFSGGGGWIPSGTLKPETVLTLGIIFLLAGSALILYLAAELKSAALVGIYLFALFSGIFYTAPPFSLAYRGWGEVLIGLNYGPTAALLGFASQTGKIDWALVPVSICLGGLLLAANLIHEMLDYEADREAGKKSWVVLAGMERGTKLFLILLVAPFIWLALLVLLKILPFEALLPLGAAAWALTPGRKLQADLSEETLLKVLKQAFGIYIAFGLTLAAGLVLAKFL
jgi:1,4-dihydroxy-2-naphthoate octaprenyltransferase